MSVGQSEVNQAVVGVQLAPQWSCTILRPALPSLLELCFPASSCETPESLNGAPGLGMRSHKYHPPMVTSLDFDPTYHERAGPLMKPRFSKASTALVLTIP